MKEIKFYCGRWNQSISENDTYVKETEETYPVLGEPTTITAKVRYCKKCNKETWDDQLDSRNLLDAYAVYRIKHNIPDNVKLGSIPRIENHYIMEMIDV